MDISGYVHEQAQDCLLVIRDRPLSAAEVEAHPEFPYITWDLKPKSQGKLSVAKNRGGPLDIAWEVHGEGENKMVVSVFSSLNIVLSSYLQLWHCHRMRTTSFDFMFGRFMMKSFCDLIFKKKASF